jgi:phosphoribosylformylglycinamidine synthase
VPTLDAAEAAESYRRLIAAMDAGLVRACHDISDGGIAVSLSEMAFTGGVGLNIDLDKLPASGEMRTDYLLFSESNARLLVEVPEAKAAAFEKAMKGSTFARIGAATKEKRLIITRKGKKVVEEPLTELISSWKTPLEARK